jgi:hypothetical protein
MKNILVKTILVFTWILFWAGLLAVLQIPGWPLEGLPSWAHFTISIVIGWFAWDGGTKWLPALYNNVKIHLNNWAKIRKLK